MSTIGGNLYNLGPYTAPKPTYELERTGLDQADQLELAHSIIERAKQKEAAKRDVAQGKRKGFKGGVRSFLVGSSSEEERIQNAEEAKRELASLKRLERDLRERKMDQQHFDAKGDVPEMEQQHFDAKGDMSEMREDSATDESEHGGHKDFGSIFRKKTSTESKHGGGLFKHSLKGTTTDNGGVIR